MRHGGNRVGWWMLAGLMGAPAASAQQVTLDGISYPTLGGAMLNAYDGATLVVDPGVYSEVGVVTISHDVSILGAGSDMVHVLNLTDAGGAVFRIDNDAVVTMTGMSIEDSVQGITATSTSGLTVTDVRFVGTSGVYGGGLEVLFTSGPVVLTDVSFVDTFATESGGGLYVSSSWQDVTLVRASFEGTSAWGPGGGLAHFGAGELTVTDSSFTDVGSLGEGGGIYVDGADRLEVQRTAFCRVLANVPSGKGGAIYGNADFGLLTNNVITSAEAIESISINFPDPATIEPGDGAAIYVTGGGHWDILNNTIAGSVGATGSGSVVVFGSSTSAIVNNTLFLDNVGYAAVFDGGAIVDGFDFNALYGNDIDGALGATTGLGSLVGIPPEVVAWSHDDDCSNDDLRPLYGSPLIEAGDPMLLDSDGSHTDIGATGGPFAVTPPDGDGDGSSEYLDCDDGDATTYPGADEYCDDLDNDCDGQVDDAPVDVVTYYQDLDGDGFGDLGGMFCPGDQPDEYVTSPGDCDEGNAEVHPDAIEACDGLDNDCDGLHDAEDDGVVDASLYYTDADGDGFGSCDGADPTAACPERICDGDILAIHVLDDGDCDDTEAASYPGATEVCDGLDNDCDTAIDLDDDDVEGTVEVYEDWDGDGFGGCDAPPCTPLTVCEVTAFHTDNGDDCHDGDPTVYPGAYDVPDNGVDEDCSGADTSTATEPGGCGCATPAPTGRLWMAWLFGAAGVWTRRRGGRQGGSIG